MRVALDSNILIYAEGGNNGRHRAAAHNVIGNVFPSQILIPIQSAAETYRWLTTKGYMDRALAASRATWWIQRFPTQETDVSVFESAMELATSHQLQFFDSIILAAAWVGGASVLLSEDMQDGFKWRGVTVANPFADKPLKIIQDILGNSRK